MPAKKKSAKKSAKVSVSAPEKQFFVSDGSVYASLADLAKGLKRMHPDTYAYHANTEKNDFANWIRDVFGEQKLAKQALAAKNQNQLARVIGTRLKSK